MTLAVRWRIADPERLVERLTGTLGIRPTRIEAPDRDEPEWAFDFRSGRLSVVRAGAGREPGLELRCSRYHPPMMDEGAIALRGATLADAERIAALLTDEGYPAGASDIEERLTAFQSPTSTVIVADMAGDVLGFIALHVVPRFEHGDRLVRILALVVDPGVRDRGLGHLLMAEAERLGRDMGAAFTELTAGHHRPEARRFYESLGYDGSVTAYLRKRI